VPPLEELPWIRERTQIFYILHSPCQYIPDLYVFHWAGYEFIVFLYCCCFFFSAYFSSSKFTYVHLGQPKRSTRTWRHHNVKLYLRCICSCSTKRASNTHCALYKFVSYLCPFCRSNPCFFLVLLYSVYSLWISSTYFVQWKSKQWRVYIRNAFIGLRKESRLLQPLALCLFFMRSNTVYWR
jgi:hypothetical protein